MIKIRITGTPKEVEKTVMELTLSSSFEVLYVSKPYKQNRKSNMNSYEAVYMDCELKEEKWYIITL